MSKTLPFFNWSLKKAQETELQSFGKARIRIIYTVLLFSLLKAAIVIGVGITHEQWRQVPRAIVAFAAYAGLLKYLLYRPWRLNGVAQVMLILGTLIIWTNIFLYAHTVNIITVQFVFMIAVSSFYTQGSLWGCIYSGLAGLPVILCLLLKGHTDMYMIGATQEVASPGFELIVLLNFVSIVLSHYLFFQAINANVAEKERLNKQLQVSIAEANRLAESRANFLSTMSHELRTPLNSVVGITELLLDDRTGKKQDDNLRILQFSALDLLSLINNVLDFNKLDSDKLVLENIPFSLSQFMRNICSVLRVKASSKGLNLVLEVDKPLENITVVSDPTRLSQVIYNLVGNAIKFTAKGSITVSVKKVDGPAPHDGVNILFAVSDTGIGIQKDRHATIFEMFAQAGADTVRKHGGTGLGLAIVKKMVAVFNGNIEVESTPGSGSRFFFTIPLATTASDGQTRTELPTELPDLGHLSVMVAEDNPVNRLIIQRQLDKMNVKPVMAENGRQAYEHWLKRDFDIIFMDIHMPEMDGYEATKMIRELSGPERSVAHIIAFTATVTEQEKILETGFDDFLYKPVNMNELLEKLLKVADTDTGATVS